MFRANDEQVSINDKLTREKFQTRVFHCLLNEISFVIALRFSLQPRLSSPRNINPDFPFILRIRHRFDIFFFRYKFLRVDPQQFWSFFTR